MARLIRHAWAVAAGALFLLAPEFALAQRQSGIQLGLDADTILVSKDVGDDRWAISYSQITGVLTGNIFPVGGGAPKFVWCDDTFTGDENTFIFDCFQADPCTVGPCGEEGIDWTSIGTGIPLPASFLALPADAAARASSSRSTGPPRRRGSRP